jgi:hypothetical protein
MPRVLRELQVQSYLLVPPTREVPFAVTIDRCGQRFGPDLWAIRFKGMTMNHDGEWEWEPIPSSRDDEYLHRCRFAAPSLALAIYDKAMVER